MPIHRGEDKEDGLGGFEMRSIIIKKESENNMKVIKVKRVKKADASDPAIQKLDDAFYAVYTPFKQTVQKNKSKLEDIVKKLGDVIIFWKQKKDEHDHIMPSKYPGSFAKYYEREEEIEKNISSASELLKHLRFMISEMKSWM